MALMAGAVAASAQTKTYNWSDINCRESRIVSWPGMTCRSTNVVTTEGNIGAFRQWSAFGTTREGYYAHMFLWEAQNSYSYVSAGETTGDFVKWLFEHGASAMQVSPPTRYKTADYVTFRDGKLGRVCVGFRRMGSFQRGGYDSLTAGVMCAPPGKDLTQNDVGIFIDNVKLQPLAR